jgi:hypothetical protein
MVGIQFGSFNGVCETAALVICPLVGSAQGVEPKCYSRNVDVGGTLIFQPCTYTNTSSSFIFHLPCPPCFFHLGLNDNEQKLTYAFNSNVFRTYRGDHHDRNHDPTHSE